MVETSATATTATGRSQAVRRLSVVGAAVVAAVVVWALATLAFGVDLRSPAFGSQPSQEIGIGPVIFTSAIASLAGWGLLALLERVMRAKARLVWTVVAGIFLLLSLGGPLSGTGTTGSSRAVLVVLHLVVGAVLIGGLSRTAANRT